MLGVSLKCPTPESPWSAQLQSVPGVPGVPSPRVSLKCPTPESSPECPQERLGMFEVKQFFLPGLRQGRVVLGAHVVQFVLLYRVYILRCRLPLSQGAASAAWDQLALLLAACNYRRSHKKSGRTMGHDWRSSPASLNPEETPRACARARSQAPSPRSKPRPAFRGSRCAGAPGFFWWGFGRGP